MDVRSFDTLTRRASLLTLGGAALAAAVPGLAATKKKKNKKKAGKVCKKKEKKRCNSDAAACVATGAALCAGEPTCLATINLCCDTCSAAGFLTCLVASTAA